MEDFELMLHYASLKELYEIRLVIDRIIRLREEQKALVEKLLKE